jgi:hypothetical protein
MAMQATRISHPELTSGTFAAERSSAIDDDSIGEAYRLVCEIERLLAPRENDVQRYGRRLALALAESLKDQLADLRGDARAKKLV